MAGGNLLFVRFCFWLCLLQSFSLQEEDLANRLESSALQMSVERTHLNDLRKGYLNLLKASLIGQTSLFSKVEPFDYKTHCRSCGVLVNDGYRRCNDIEQYFITIVK